MPPELRAQKIPSRSWPALWAKSIAATSLLLAVLLVAGHPAGTAPAPVMRTVTQYTPDGGTIVRHIPVPQTMADRRDHSHWLILWDAGPNPGDIIRIDAGTFTATVTLTKEPVKLHMPNTLDGPLRITGIHATDADGIAFGTMGSHNTALVANPVSQRIIIHVREGQTLNESVR